MSALKFKSFLQNGIVNVQEFSSIQRFFKIFKAYNSSYLLPIKLLINSKSKSIVTVSCLFSYESENSVILIQFKFFSSSEAIKLIHLIGISGSISFSNTFRESVLIHNLLADFLTNA